MTQALAGILIGSCMVGAGLVDGKSTAGPNAEIEAKCWFNNPVYRLRDDRRVVLFFFECDSKEAAAWTKRLNRMSRRPDMVIIGLTDDGRAAAERFIKRRNVRFTIGAGSRTAKRLGIRELPALRVVDAKDRSRIRVAESFQVLVTIKPATRPSPNVPIALAGRFVDNILSLH